MGVGVGAETGTGDLILRARDFQQQKRPIRISMWHLQPQLPES